MYDPTHVNLEGLQPDIREAAIYLINAFREVGIPAVITSGRRSIEHNISIGGAVQSRHLIGRAVDIGFIGIASDSDYGLELLRAGGALWKLMGGRWGGDFASPDPLHFDG